MSDCRERERERGRFREGRNGGEGRGGAGQKRRRSQSPGRYRRFNREGDFERRKREQPNSRRRTFGGYGGGRDEETLTYKQFIAQLDEDITPEEAVRQYNEYKRGQAANEKKQYFLRSKESLELMNKYNPDTIAQLLERGCEMAKVPLPFFATKRVTRY